MRYLISLITVLIVSLPAPAQEWSLQEPLFPVWEQPGETVRFVVTGPPGQSPALVTGAKTLAPFQETSEGTYQAIWQVPSRGAWPLSLKAGPTSEKLGSLSSKVMERRLTTKEETVTRQGPAPLYDRHTPAVAGVVIGVDGARGAWYRHRESGVWFDSSTCSLEEGPGPDNRVKRVLVENGPKGDALLRLQCESVPWVEVVHRPEEGRLTLQVYAAHTVFDIKRPSGVAPFLRRITTRPTTQPRTVCLEVTTPPEGLGGYHLENGDKPGELLVRLRQPVPGALSGMTITVDAGHGGPKDTGTVGHLGLAEKTLNLRVSQALARILQEKGARVVMTRTEDLDLGLAERVALSRKAHSQLYLSIHHNARPSVEEGKGYHGTDIYWYQPQSQPLARALADPIADALDEPLRSSRYRSFAVIRQTFSPAVLLEFQYLSNPTLEKNLLDRPEYPEKAAAAVVKGLERYLGTLR